MYRYYLNKNKDLNPNGNNEVHKENCWKVPAEQNRVDLGLCSDGIEAVERAKRLGYEKADGCILCCPEAHKA